MRIREITQNKKQYLPLLLLADEQETMIDRYLDRGSMFVISRPRPTPATTMSTRSEFLRMNSSALMMKMC